MEKHVFFHVKRFHKKTEIPHCLQDLFLHSYLQWPLCVVRQIAAVIMGSAACWITCSGICRYVFYLQYSLGKTNYYPFHKIFNIFIYKSRKLSEY